MLVPDLREPGGVANYYRTLQLDGVESVDYFFVTSYRREGAVRTGLRLAAKYCRFVKLLMMGRYHLVHLNPSFNARSVWRDAIFLLVARLLGRSVVTFWRGWQAEFESELRASKVKHWAFGVSWGKCRAFIVLSERFAEKLRRLGVTGATYWVESTVADDAQWDPVRVRGKIATYGSGPVYALFMSRVIASKGIFTAIEAIVRTRRRAPGLDLRLTVAGTGPELEEARAYAKARAADYVEFLGHITGEAKGRVLARSHVLLFPTRYGEGLPNVVLEAMLYGMPVISRPQGGIGDFVVHGRNGYLTQSEDADAFAEFLLSLADPKVYARMAELNVRTAAERFRPADVRQRLLKIYGAVCG